jgi:hypothetical protein
MGQSEFGKGLVICLVKFAEHAHRWQTIKKEYEDLRNFQNKTDRMITKIETGKESFSESRAVQMFFDGAYDHLREIEVPDAWKNTEITTKIDELVAYSVQIKHDWFEENGSYSEKDVFKTLELCQEIALLIDKQIGLTPDIGKW